MISTSMSNKVRANQQSGFVSIIVSMIIMVVLSLITIGFAQIMAREQRQALDRQLSTQAFYAAESGVNDVARAIKANPASVPYGGTCSAGQDISTDGSIRNTCVTYSSTVPDIRFDALAPNPYDPRTFPLKATSGVTSYIDIQFSPTSVIGGGVPLFRPAGTTTLPQSGTAVGRWNASTGLMKVYLVPFRNNMNRQQLIDATGYFILYPRSGAGITSIAFSGGIGANYGTIQPVNCDAVNGCRARITGINALTYNNLYAVISTVYQPNDIVVDATDTAGGSQSWTDVQAIVDSTGRTSDVVRRIQVRLPIESSMVAPAGALIAADPAGAICKYFETNISATPSPVGSCSF